MSKANFAMAVSLKKAAKKPKKMAAGGMAKNDSAKSEARPMPNELDNDAKMANQNRGNKAPGQDSWSGRPTVAQAQANDSRKVMPIKHPKMVPSNAFSVRLRDEEDHLQDSAGVNDGPQQQPPEHDNEEGANRRGPRVPALDMKMMAEGGKVGGAKTGGAKTGGAKTSTTGNKTKTGGSNPGGASTGGAGTVTITTRDLGSKGITVSNVGGKTDSKNHGGMDPGDEDDDGKTMMARGGPVMQPEDEGLEAMERADEAHLMSSEDPSEDMGEAEARSLNEEGPNRQGPRSPDLSLKMMAEGGMAHDEIEDQLHDSIAAAIMAKRDRMASGGSVQSGSSDMNYAEGGEVGDINGRDSIYSDHSSQADLKRNAEEDANMEDQSSFDALRKENYSESAGLRQLNQPEDSNRHGHELSDADAHSMVESIRRKMAQRRQFSK